MMVYKHTLTLLLNTNGYEKSKILTQPILIRKSKLVINTNKNDLGTHTLIIKI